MTTAQEIKAMISSGSKEKSFFKRADVKAALKEMGMTKKAATDGKKLWLSDDLRTQMADILNGNGGLQEAPKSDYEKAAEWASKKFNQDLEQVKSAMDELQAEATYKGWTAFQTAAAAAKSVEKLNNL